MTCYDCGASSTGPLCGRCADVAVALGLTVDERLRMLGAEVLDVLGLVDELAALGVVAELHLTPKGKKW